MSKSEFIEKWARLWFKGNQQPIYSFVDFLSTRIANKVGNHKEKLGNLAAEDSNYVMKESSKPISNPQNIPEPDWLGGLKQVMSDISETMISVNQKENEKLVYLSYSKNGLESQNSPKAGIVSKVLGQAPLNYQFINFSGQGSGETYCCGLKDSDLNSFRSGPSDKFHSVIILLTRTYFNDPTLKNELKAWMKLRHASKLNRLHIIKIEDVTNQWMDFENDLTSEGISTHLAKLHPRNGNMQDLNEFEISEELNDLM